ncbi:MAG: carbonic anhydrase family protein [Chloroflexota bacterium]
MSDTIQANESEKLMQMNVNPTHTPDCPICMAQSPIDLTKPTKAALSPIAFQYAETDVAIFNNGYTLQVDCIESDAASNTITIDDRSYRLVQFHFHAPSEHTVDGQFSPMELHLVHADDDGNSAVIGVFMVEGQMHEALAPVWSVLTTEEIKMANVRIAGHRVNIATLLPAGRAFYRYDGSLTTPPYSEGVLWSVMQSSIETSAQQIAAFTALFDGTNRPIQSLNDRCIQLGGG